MAATDGLEVLPEGEMSEDAYQAWCDTFEEPWRPADGSEFGIIDHVIEASEN